jgi:serine/threonine protein kinase/AAA+ superfamily predicted ATPase
MNPVGEGSFGQVYRAYDLNTKSYRALKIYLRDASGVAFDEYRLRCRQEGEIASKISDHAHLVVIYDIIDEPEDNPEYVVLVMEYIDGGSLEDRLKAAREQEQPMSIPETVLTGLGIAQGLAELHRLQIVHTDLSPRNILLAADGVPKITDLGQAQWRFSVKMATQLTKGQMCHPGTPGYRSPEHDSPDPLPFDADVYCLGLLWFEMLTNRQYHLEAPGTSPALYRPDTPEWLEGLVNSMLQQNRRKRPSARDLVERILQGSETGQETPPGDAGKQGGKPETRSGSRRESVGGIKLPGKNRTEHVPELVEPPVEIVVYTTLPEKTLEDALTRSHPAHADLLKTIDFRVKPHLPAWVNEHLFDPAGHELPRWLKWEAPADWLGQFFRTVDAELAVSAVQNGFLTEDPRWFFELNTRAEASIARVFILWGNINDYVFHPRVGYLPLERFLLEQYARGKEIYVYSLSQGLHRYRSGRVEAEKREAQEGQDPNLWLRVRRDLEELDRILRDPGRNDVVVLIEYLNKLFPPQTSELEREFFLETVLRWAVSPEVLGSKNQVIMTTPNIEDIHQDLRNSFNKIDVLEIPRPDSRARCKFLTALFASQNFGLLHRGRRPDATIPMRFGQDFSRSSTVTALDELANISSGLNCMGLEDLFLRSQVETGGTITRSYVITHKKNLLATESAGLLEVVEPRFGFDKVGGLQLIRQRLEGICASLRSTDRLVRQTVPMGILFLGPPGTGKTLVAEALAKESGLNFVKLGNIRAMWVGQSERNLAVALSLIAAMEPVVVFIDEIDQSEGQRSQGGDSGVGGRIFSKLLEFMSNSSLRGRILWIGASNAPERIDEAMKRPGRFDLKLPFFMPEFEDRKQIFRAILNNLEIPYDSRLNFSWLAQETELFSGAEIEVVINEALRVAIQRCTQAKPGQRVVLLPGDFVHVLGQYHPGKNRQDVLEVERRMLEEIPFVEYWPQRYRDSEIEPAEEPARGGEEN